jgi:suppressor for copper-sensitivity B
MPIVASIRDGSAAASLKVTGTIYACSDICAPFPVDLSATMPPGYRNADLAGQIAPWLARSPGSAASGVKVGEVFRADGGDIVARFSSSSGLDNPQAFLDLGMQGFGSLKALSVTGDVAEARFEVRNLQKNAPDMSLAKLVLSDGITPPLETTFDIGSGTGDVGIGILLVALAGGLILNAMPCVFPVLAIKLLLLVSIDERRLTPSLFATALGVVSTFLLIGVVLASLKAAGHTVGWGMQFQQPVFLTGMSLLLLGFAASMGGAFDVILPSSLATKLTRTTDGSGIGKSFLQGLVLTLLATPCSAPFVGTAVGYGLSSGAPEILSIFAAMGVGMAAPFIVLGVVPRLTRIMPRPGRWMETVKHATGVAMMATAGWLLSLLYVTSATSALAVGTAGAFVALLLTGCVWRRMLALHAIALAVAPAMFVLPGLSDQKGGIAWEPFEPARIEQLVDEGRTVFLDISADWCLTCKVNERGVLATEAVNRMIGGTVAMKGDWTGPDERIASLLKSHGRYGIPFYLVVGPGATDGIVLPELLTDDAIREAISTASAK